MSEERKNERSEGCGKKRKKTEINRQRYTDREICRQTEKYTDRHRDIQTDVEIYRQT